jgi:predicted phage terminase large subunit-like protein
MKTTQILRNKTKEELARRNFWFFCLYYDKEFFISRKFLKEIADAFQEVEEGKIKSLSVSMPPRAGKSYITSLFCAWTLGRNPSHSVMRNTCTATLYLKFSYDVRQILKTELFQNVFDCRLSDDKQNLTGWNVTGSKMVSYFGAGVGGTIIGFGASKLGITDDLYTGLEAALSDTKNDNIFKWKEATHDSRFESGCARIDIGTRWSVHDVIGKQMEEGIYEKSIVVPALTENDKSFCEAVMTTEEYLYKRSKTSKEVWLAEYQQTPVDIEGRLFGKLNTITKEDFNKLLPDSLGTLGYIDVADQGKDYTALAIGHLIGNKVYISDILYNTHNTDITIPQSAELLNKNKVKYCRVESNSMGAMFSRHLQRETTTKILQVNNQQNKITRIIMQSVFIQNNFFFVESDNVEFNQFIENVERFSKEGKNKNDDAPDCLAGLSMFIQGMFPKYF